MQQLTNQLGPILDAFQLHSESLRELSMGAATLALNALWQGALVAAAVAVSLKLAPRIAAAHRFAIWATGFAVLIGLPMLSLPYLLHPAAANSFALVQEASAASTVFKPLILLDFRWSIAIAALWLALSLYRTADLAFHSIRLRRLWSTAKPVQSGPEIESLLHVRGRNQVQICASSSVERPGVIGFFAPRILVPNWLLDRLTPDELAQIVLHETEHLRRSDDWTNLLQKLTLVVFPLNPALLWIERRLCLEREMACDEGVVRITGAPRAYAACLASLAEQGLERSKARREGNRLRTTPIDALSLGVWQGRTELARRIHTLLLRKRTIGTAAARTLLTAFTLILVMGSVELAHCPQLVAFIASPAGSASLNPAQIAGARNASAPYAPLISEISAQGTNGAYLTNLKAIMPSEPTEFHRGFRSMKPAPSAGRAIVPETTSHSSENLPDPISAELPVRASVQGQIDGRTQPEQGWIVFTAWEQVDSPASTPPLQSDHSDASADNAGNPIQPSGEPATHIAVTQLIFRVVPANSVSVSPSAAMQLRGGWLVLEM